MPTFEGTSGPDLINGSAGDDNIYGRGGDDVLNGLAGNDRFYWYETLSSDDGLDTVNGGDGVDTVRLQWLTSFTNHTVSLSAVGTTAVVELGSGGIGDPRYAVNYSQNVENLDLMFGPPGEFTSVALFLDDMTGTAMTGRITIDARGLGSLNLMTAETLNALTVYGTATGDNFTGGAGNDQLFGYAGNDVLDGGRDGADTLIGGLGDDTYVLTDFRDSFVELPGQGVDSLIVGLRSWTLAAHLENLTVGLSGNSQGFNGIGNAADNRISGGGGADYLIGLGGDDRLSGNFGLANTLQGGVGNDTYVVAVAGDTIIEYAGEGTDTVETFLTSYTLKAHLENLTFASSSGSGYGNAVANRMQGATGADTLYGLDGDDVLLGGAGNDRLVGGNGVDTLTGGLGGDEMTGGAGADLFVYNSGSEAADLIHDFTHASGDRIDVTAIMDALGPLGDDPFGNGVLSLQATTWGSGALPAVDVMFDPDGAGPAAAQRLLTVLGNAIQQDSFIF
ncbi:calcium-binding protein [Brevundimonas sp.]|uniref:calcium-binding protein n=1 Tax=Brevundimonas sp. TaxID=1871086 RepID=UPI002D3457D5|nr:calcium-binding protein [Brevundimonas sp.]HYC98332.1 calcium-binding protein [Brevundimonas sp.]